MKHVSLLFCSWDAQVKIKSPMIIIRTTALPSNWAKTDWIAGNTENNTEYTNWQQDKELSSLHNCYKDHCLAVVLPNSGLCNTCVDLISL